MSCSSIITGGFKVGIILLATYKGSGFLSKTSFSKISSGGGGFFLSCLDKGTLLFFFRTSFFLIGVGIPHYAQAEETKMEKVEVKVKDAKRSVKRKMHRLQEKMCKRSDVECLEKKAKHRAEEAKESIKDKKDEIKNKVNE